MAFFAWLWLTAPATAQQPWYEGFEASETSWHLVGGNAQFRVETHQRVQGEAHSGEGSEHIRLSGAGAGEVYFSHEIGQPRLIPDLLPTVWVKADRPGVQLVAQVVLPRSLDPQTKRPLSVLLRGSAFSSVGRWQQLRLDDLPRLLMRQVWELRTRYGPWVDSNDAYVERLLLNVYGGPGVTSIWIDDLDIAGYVPAATGKAMPAQPIPMPDWWAAVPSASYAGRFANSDHKLGGMSEPAGIRVADSVLLVNTRPFLPRAIQHRGEPLAYLRDLGFNTVWTLEPPSEAFLREAAKTGLWVICPPPQGPKPESPDGSQTPVSEIGPAYDPVLAWHLGTGLNAEQLPMMEHWVEQIRAADRRRIGRPRICQPDSNLLPYSRLVDFLLLGRSPLGTSLDLYDYGIWVRERPRLARGGTPVWTTIQTQPGALLRQQWAALGQSPLPSAFSPEQLRLLTYIAVSAGTRGLLFESYSPLNGTDADTRLRAATLELLNLEMDLAEPWVAAGSYTGTVRGEQVDGKKSSPQTGVLAATLQRAHSRLLVPLWTTPRSQHVTGQATGSEVSFVVSAPEDYRAYLLLPDGLRPIRLQRVAGGVRATLEEFDLTSLILLTQDDKTIQEVSTRLMRSSKRLAEIERELAAVKLRAVDEMSNRWATRLPPVSQASAWRATAETQLKTCDSMLAAGRYGEAYLAAHRASRPLRWLERSQWESVLPPLRSPVASPGAVMFASLPAHFGLVQRIAASPAGPNQLPAANFEDLGAMFQAGWQHMQHPAQGLQCNAELTPEAAHSGRLGLRLSVQPGAADRAPAQVETPPLWMTSPPLRVEAGQLLRIQGWVQVPRPIAGSVDGLTVLDSFGGEALAERFTRTNGWTSFTLYRVAPQAGEFTVTFALSGLGEAWLDDVTIEPLGPRVDLPASPGVAAAPPGR
jgi:hypothetical protein